MKTGSTWVTQATQNAGLFVAKVSGVHGTPQQLVRHEHLRHFLDGRTPFTAVRNPVSWYASRWSATRHRKRIIANKMGNMNVTRWTSSVHARLDADLPGEDTDFPKWVHRITSEQPAWLSRWYAMYLGRGMDGMRTIRTESLTEELIEALADFGEDFDPADIRGTPASNEADPEVKKLAKYDRTALGEVLKSERAIFRLLGYSADPGDYDRHMA